MLVAEKIDKEVVRIDIFGQRKLRRAVKALTGLLRTIGISIHKTIVPIAVQVTGKSYYW